MSVRWEEQNSLLTLDDEYVKNVGDMVKYNLLVDDDRLGIVLGFREKHDKNVQVFWNNDRPIEYVQFASAKIKGTDGTWNFPGGVIKIYGSNK